MADVMGLIKRTFGEHLNQLGPVFFFRADSWVLYLVFGVIFLMMYEPKFVNLILWTVQIVFLKRHLG